MNARQPGTVADPDLAMLERSLRKPRSLLSSLLSLATGAMTIVALLPLFSVLYLLGVRGGTRLGLSVLGELPPAALMPGGGFGNAIVGTLVVVGIAAALSVPVGVLGAIYVAEFGAHTRTAITVRFAAKLLTGLPSILAGVFAYAAVVLVTGGFSAPAGGVALAVLMLPIVLLTADEALRSVPDRMREAAIGLGATPTQTVLRVVVPTALPGILTGAMLAVARGAGETAPLLFTALFSEFWISRTAPQFLPHDLGDLMKPTPTLAVLIYNFSGSPFENQVELAWTAALVLVAIVFVVNIAGQQLGRWSARR